MTTEKQTRDRWNAVPLILGIKSTLLKANKSKTPSDFQAYNAMRPALHVVRFAFIKCGTDSLLN